MSDYIKDKIRISSKCFLTETHTGYSKCSNLNRSRISMNNIYVKNSDIKMASLKYSLKYITVSQNFNATDNFSKLKQA